MRNYINNEFTLLSEEQVFESQKIDIIRQTGGKCAISDFAILLGAYVCYYDHVDGDSSLRGRTGLWYLSSSDGVGDVRDVSTYGARIWTYAGKRSGAVRPALPYSNISDISTNGVRGRSGILEVEYGEYPQYAPDLDMQRTLESELSAGKLKKTGKVYTTDSRRWDANYEIFKAREHQEYEYNGKKYVKVKYIDTDSCILSNGETYNNGDEVWIEVAPVKWLVDEKSRLMLSKTCLASGIRFCNDGQYRGDFKSTEMYMFLNNYFAKDIVHKMTPEEKKNMRKIENKLKKEEILMV